MKAFLTEQSMSKKRNVMQERENDKIYTKHWRADLESGIQNERDKNDKVNKY